MPDWRIGGVEIVLGAASIILTGVAIVLGIFAVWGYRDIRAAAIKAAETEGRRAAEDVAMKEIRAYLDKAAGGEDISAAYKDKPQ